MYRLWTFVTGHAEERTDNNARHVSVLQRFQRSMMADFKTIWTAFGEPFPGAVRFIRHRILGPVFPARPWTPPPPKPVLPAEDIDVIIWHAGDAYGLKQTLDSVLLGNIMPRRIIVLDETFGEVQIPMLIKHYDHPIQIMPVPYKGTLLEHIGIRTEASEYLVFLEGGCRLSPNCLHESLHAIRTTPNAALTYQGDRLIFPLMVRRDALLTAYGTVQGDHLPSLCRDIVAKRWVAVPQKNMVDEYSMHAYQDACNHPFPLATLFVSLSGRTWTWPNIRHFLEMQTYPHDRMHLVLADASHDPEFGMHISKWLEQSDYGSHTLIRGPFVPEGLIHQSKTLRQLYDMQGQLYQQFADLCTTPIACMLDEDILPPLDAFRSLAAHLNGDVISVSGIYRDRLSPQVRAWAWNETGRAVSFPQMGSGVQEVGGNGLGCVVLDGYYLRESVLKSGPPLCDIEQSFYRQAVFQEKHRALADWDCRCKQYLSPDHWVAPM